MIRKNSPKAWLLAVRPTSLVASSSPVAVASSLAFLNGDFYWPPAVICLVFAVLAQCTVNMASDYFDFRSGCDANERLGLERVLLEGWITPKYMLYAALGLCAVNSLIGLSLIYYGGWGMVPVGIAVAIVAIAYSGGPYPLAYNGWGDICVFLFYGIIPVGFTYYLQGHYWPLSATICGAAVGLPVVNILVANNYRDRTTDAEVEKNTTVVLFGEPFGRWFYFFNGCIAVVLCQYFWYENRPLAAILPISFLFFHIATWRKMVRIGSGKGLIPILDESGRNVMIFALSLSAGLIITAFWG